jgi:multidrug efflux pump subunit AcrA (membrane-fusion protein)
MIRQAAFRFAPLLLASAAIAGEITIEKRPFTVERTFGATVLPTEGAQLIQIEPNAWPDYQISEIAAHGSKVAKGDTLVRFDAEEIDRKLADTRRALETANLSLAQTAQDLAHLEETAPHKLDSLKRAAEIAREENSYFTKTRRKAAEESSAQNLERRKQILENEREELTQLAKMYEADDLTEDTEEIILVRQKNDVIAAEFALRMETLDHQRTIGVTLPREAVSLANNERDTAIAIAKAEQEIPRSIALKKLEVEELKTTAERAKQSLADLEHDRKLFEFKAPADGWFYHGAIENGRWTTGDGVKSLVKHGRPAPNRPFATFVPSIAKSVLTAFLDDATARSLKADATGTVVLPGREDLEISAKLSSLASIPGADGLYRADLSATWPKELNPATGSSAQIHLIAYHNPEAVTVPTNALRHGAKGWTVEIKLADGKTESRGVKRGRVSGESTEILSGLEAGQVVITPDK